MFFSYWNHRNQPEFPRWILVQAENATMANTKLAFLIGEESVASSFDKLPTYYPGTSEPHIDRYNLANAPVAASWNVTSSYRVYYADGTIINGKL